MFPCCSIIPNTILKAVQIWYTYKHMFCSKIVYMVHSYRGGKCGLLCSPDSYEHVINCSGISIFVSAQKKFLPRHQGLYGNYCIKCHYHVNGFIDLIKILSLPNSIKIHRKHNSDPKIPDLDSFHFNIKYMLYTCIHAYIYTILCIANPNTVSPSQRLVNKHNNNKY